MKLTLDLAAKTTTLVLRLVVYMGIPIFLSGLWYLMVKLVVEE
jgi:hypothetical protein